MTTTNINQDFIQFKNDILKDIREFKIKINNDLRLKNASYDSFLLEFQNRIEKLEKENKNSNTSIIEIKSKLNYLNEFMSFKQKIENMVFNHDIKIKMNTDEMDRIKIKYDKIIDQNLIIPGILGGNGRFKTLKDYINNNNSEIGKIKYSLEEEKKLSVEFKKKFDNLPKTMINMIDSAVRRSNEYTEIKQKDIEKNTDIKINDYNDKLMEIKVEYLENKKNFEDKIKKIKNEINHYSSIKDEILDILNEKINKLNENGKVNDYNLENIKKEVEELKKSKNKFDNQVLNNTQLINEIKYKLKTINNIRHNNNNNYGYNNNNFMNNNNNNLINNNYINSNNNYNNYNNNFEIKNTITDNNNEFIPQLSAIKENNELNVNINNNQNNSISRNLYTVRKLSYRSFKRTIQDFCFSENKNNKFKKDNELDGIISPNAKKLKNNTKTIQARNSSKLNNNIINLIQKEGFENKLSIKYFDEDSSSIDEKESVHCKEPDKKEKILNSKSNKEINKNVIISSNNNNNPILIDEDKNNKINKINNTEENTNDVNKTNDKKESDSAIFKSKIKDNEKKRIIKIKNSNKYINDIISNEVKAKSYYNSNNSNDTKNIVSFENPKANITINEYNKSNKKKVNFNINTNNNKSSIKNDNIKDDIKDDIKENFNDNTNTNIIYSKNENITNNNFNADNYSNETDKDSIVPNIRSNHIKNLNIENRNLKTNIPILNIKNNNIKNKNITDNLKSNNNINIINNDNKKINIFNKIENYYQNYPVNRKINLNLGIIDSFLNFSPNKKKKNLKTFNNYTSRNNDSQSFETDIKVNNIDLFENTRKSITDKNNNKNYSFNGKKLKIKKKKMKKRLVLWIIYIKNILIKSIKMIH